MADDEVKVAWEKAEKAITKGKGESALKILRDVDPNGTEQTTLRLAGHATWLEAKSGNNRTDYRRAASLLRDATKKNPRDKKADRTYNELLNEMQDKGISETAFPASSTTGRPRRRALSPSFSVSLWCWRASTSPTVVPQPPTLWIWN